MKFLALACVGFTFGLAVSAQPPIRFPRASTEWGEEDPNGQIIA